MISRTLKAVLRSLGLSVTRTSNRNVLYLEDPPRSQFEHVLYRQFQRLEGLHFIQVGANDGVRYDPINRFVTRYHWTGVLLEPIPRHFQALARKHGANPQLALIQAALDCQAGWRTIYEVAKEAIPPSADWVSGLASFERARILSTLKSLNLPESALAEQEVPTVTWDEVWGKLPQGRCDLLLLDTEGHDLILLRSLNLKLRRPRVIHFEHGCLSREDRLAFYGELLDLDYEFATEGVDTTAWLAEETG